MYNIYYVHTNDNYIFNVKIIEKKVLINLIINITIIIGT